MDRAYSVLNIKSYDEDQRILRGVATSPDVDRMGDIVVPEGIRFKNPSPLLWQHQHDKPVGTVRFDRPTAKGMTFEARLPKIEEPGALKDRVDEAWASVKAGLVTAVSIGFRVVDDAVERMKDGGLKFLSTEVMELSLVTIPANADCTITTIKSIDSALRAASGNSPGTVDPPPGVSGHQSQPAKRGFFFVPNKGKDIMKTIQEQISALEAARQAKAARMGEIMQKSIDEGRSTDEAESEEFDTLETEVKTADDDLVRLRKLEKMNIAKATPVTGVKDGQTAAQVRGGTPIQVKQNVAKGTGFTRYAMALAASRGNRLEAVEYAKRWSDSTPEVETVLRAAVAAGTTTDADWAKPLVEYQNLASEFVSLLRPETIIGRIDGFRRVPFNVKMPTQLGGSTVGWVGEGAPKPVGELSFGQISLGMAKAAGIIVMTEELVRSSSPSAEAIVRADLTAAIAQFLDRQFVDPAVAAVANTSPASITNGATYITASGTDADALKADVASLFRMFIAANLPLSSGVWIMSPTAALAIGMMQNPLGQAEFTGISMNGGTFFGLPVVVSNNIPQSVVDAGATPATVVGEHVILVSAGDILLADDDGITLDVSREASLQMNSTPSAGASQLVSLWQNNLVGLRCETYKNWARRRQQSVAYISGANYAA